MISNISPKKPSKTFRVFHNQISQIAETIKHVALVSIFDSVNESLGWVVLLASSYQEINPKWRIGSPVEKERPFITEDKLFTLLTFFI